MLKTVLIIFISITSLFFFTACGGGGGGGGDSTPPNTSLQGEIVYGPTQGVDYVCSSGLVGTTNSLADFNCNDGDNVSFYLGSILIATLDAKSGITTPYEFFSDDITAALNYVRLIQALNIGGANTYGPIIIDKSLVSLLPSTTNFSDPNFENTVEALLGVSLITQEEAQLNLNQAIVDAGGTLPVGVGLPVANAGSDQSIAVLTGTLDGSLSYDPDGDSLTYQWTVEGQPVGSNVSLSSTTIASPNFTVDVGGIYYFDLQVNDGTSSSVDSVTITVTPASVNLPPIANAGVTQNVLKSSLVVLDGSLSTDPENDVLTYSWVILTQPSGVSLSNANTVSPSFTPDADGPYLIELTVSDTSANTSIDTITVVASTANAAPVAQAGSDVSADVNEVIALDGSLSSDAEGLISSYTWSVITKPGGSTATLLSSTTVVNPNFTGDVSGTYVVQLIVSDGILNSAPDTVTVTVSQAQAVKKTGQVLSTVSGDDGSYQKGAALDYTLAADIVSDGVTGLMWQDDNPTVSSPISGNSAEAYCSALSLGGFTDWRLPLVDELLSIAQRDQYAMAVDETYFRTIGNFRQLWSGTVIDTDERRLVDFYFGDESSVASAQSYPVRCVRGSASTSTLQRDAVNNVVIDTQNKLVWQDNTSPSEEEWAGAIGYCEGLILNGSTEWRLPNINELLTVVDFESTRGIYKNTFNYNPDNAWSSTSVVGKSSNAFSVYNPSSSFFFFTTYYKSHVSSDESKTSSLFSSTRKNPKCVMDLP